MTERATNDCSRCQELERLVQSLQSALQTQVADLQATVAALQVRLADLECQLAAARKNSGNSSKPPSSDVVSPRRKAPRSQKRRRGGQPGHARHERAPFPPEQIDRGCEYRYDACPGCGGELQDLPESVQTLQQVEIEERPFRVAEHRRIGQWCPACRQFHQAPLPEELVRAGLVGPRLTALVGWFKGVCHMSYSAIRKFFRDCLGVPISRGYLAKLVAKVSHSLQDPYEELLNLLAQEARLNVDETGHKEPGRRLWTWCFRAALYTVFKITPSRGSEVLVETLGQEFNGILGCDYFSAYRKYMKEFGVELQFCLAHLIRDVKFLAEHPDADNRDYGRRLLALLRKLFGAIHRREEYASEATFRRALERIRADLVWEATLEAPDTREAANLAERFYQHTDSYFRFITTPGIEPTNNLAEQAIRFVAIHRRLTQGTRGSVGQRWVERMATAVTTCAQQGRSAFEFFCHTVAASFGGHAAPSLLPNTS
jgi:transposase